jgi:NADH:ubiquinone oxidoreductase subunit 4 (subunit M)
VAVTAIVTVCAVALLFVGERDVHLPVTWLPGAGEWRLHVGGVGRYALIVTAATALAARIAAARSGAEVSPAVEGVWLIALASANLAFLSGHFLQRYLALEIVALCVAGSVVIQARDERGLRSSGFVYLLLRVGDAGFLAAILLLADAGGTLVIGDALEAGLTMASWPRAWVVAGLALAVWVKVGAWPLHGWQHVGRVLPSGVGTWLYGVLMPQLGLYLLYRVTPLMAAGPLHVPILVMGVVSAAAAALAIVGASETPPPIRTYGGAALGAVAIAFAAAGFSPGVVALLVMVAPLQLWAGLASGVPRERATAREMRWLEVVTDGVLALRRTVERGVFDRGPVWVADAVAGGARAVHRSVEQGGFERMVHGTAQMVVGASQGLQRLHTGKLRTGLVWVALTLLVVILAVRLW